jgi:DNA-binding transcriptional ArsR family regulator
MTPRARRPATDAEARALASTTRLRILRVCLYQARTNKEIAAALRTNPATTLHHVRRLVDTGFLAAQAERRGTRGAREIPYRATGKSWRIETPAKTRALLDTFLEELALVPIETVETVRLGLRLDAAGHAEFDARLLALLEEFRGRSDEAAQGAPWSVFVALHPDPNAPTLAATPARVTDPAAASDGLPPRVTDPHCG